jgi:hypothetical protein
MSKPTSQCRCPRISPSPAGRSPRPKHASNRKPDPLAATACSVHARGKGTRTSGAWGRPPHAQLPYSTACRRPAFIVASVSRWVGLLEAVGEPFHDERPIWNPAVHPSRVGVRTILALPLEHGVPVLAMCEELSVFRSLDNPNRWQGPFRGSPVRRKPDDAEVIIRALEDAKANPVARPLGRVAKRSARAAARREPVKDTVVVPEDDTAETAEEAESAGTAHAEIQYLLVKLAADMGYRFRVASNGQSRPWKGQRLGDMPRRREQLPQQFDPVVNRTIELIDVLGWTRTRSWPRSRSRAPPRSTPGCCG